jgi:phosphatidylserine/phosphatidylglycerophosphate/cardiolipin synthase-like enzyme
MTDLSPGPKRSSAPSRAAKTPVAADPQAGPPSLPQASPASSTGGHWAPDSLERLNPAQLLPRHLRPKHAPATSAEASELRRLAQGFATRATGTGSRTQRNERAAITATRIKTYLALQGLGDARKEPWQQMVQACTELISSPQSLYARAEAPLLATANSLTFLPDGQASLQCICSGLLNARSEAVMQSFIFNEGSQQAQALFAAILDKHSALQEAAPPIKPFRIILAINRASTVFARLLVPATQNFGNRGGGAFLNSLGSIDSAKPAAGAMNLQSLCQILDPRLIDCRVVAIRHAGRSLDHKKLYTFDGDLAVVPTHNISGVHSESLGQRGEVLAGVRDMGILLQGGNAAAALRNDIVRTCRLRGRLYFSSTTQAGRDLRAAKVTRPEAMRWATYSLDPHPLGEPGTVPVILAPQDPRQKFLDMASVGHTSPALHALTTLLDSANTSLKIMTPNLQIQEFLERLKFALARGVQVNILLTEGENQKNAQYGGHTNEAAANLLKNFAADIGRAHLLHVHWNREVNPNSPGELYAPWGWAPGALHAKLYIADDGVVGTGSYNLDYQSFKSAEDMVFFQQPQDNPLSAYFDKLHGMGEVFQAHAEKMQRLPKVQRLAASLLGTRRSTHGGIKTDSEVTAILRAARALPRSRRATETQVTAYIQNIVQSERLLEPQRRALLQSFIGAVRQLRLRPSLKMSSEFAFSLLAPALRLPTPEPEPELPLAKA